MGNNTTAGSWRCTVPTGLTEQTCSGSISGNSTVARRERRARSRRRINVFRQVCASVHRHGERVPEKELSLHRGRYRVLHVLLDVPLILAIISIWDSSWPNVDQVELAAELAEVIPISSGFLAHTVKGVASAKVITGIASVVLLMWASSAAFGAMRRGSIPPGEFRRPAPLSRNA